MSEKNASSRPAAKSVSSAPRLRSCVTCRSRKVRCDKLSPCSNCRRANIVCIVPPTDRPPRWARRLEHTSNNAAAATASDSRVDHVMERLRTLEGLVKELSGQLEQSQAGITPVSVTRDAEAEHSSSPTTNAASNVQKDYGRLVLHDANRSHYISSGFWSRVNDELDVLEMNAHSLAADVESSEDETSAANATSTPRQLDRTPSERHAFLFRHNMGPAGPDSKELHPLPSQIPFMLDVFSENVNMVLRIIHMPTVAKMARDLRNSDTGGLTPANEALMFSIYYAAITSMEEDDVVTNFGATKTDLSLKYRIGLESALAKADFLTTPSLVLVQAFAVFLFLLRRHESPGYVWMMTGLLIRMCQALGLQRDGAKFQHLSPYETEMRRRLWWAVCMLDVRSSEDQGMDLSIAGGTFDTKLPLNINDADIMPDSKQMPTERQGLTDMSFPLVSFEMCHITRRMVALMNKDGEPNLEGQRLLLNEMYQTVERNHYKYSADPDKITSWVMITIARLMVAKMTLIIYFPVLFFSASERSSDEIRAKLFTCSIEVAEYNHALNAEPRCRQWRWGFQTYTHWHAIVYLLIEISRRPWSPIVERAWVALHSTWLIPAEAYTNKNMRIWVPVRKLISKAGKHRVAELTRLKGDPGAAARLEMEDTNIPVPTSSGPFHTGTNVVDIFRERWRQLVAIPAEGIYRSTLPPCSEDHLQHASDYNMGYMNSDMNIASDRTANRPSDLEVGGRSEALYDEHPAVPQEWSDGQTMGVGFVPWLEVDSDQSVDLNSEEFNWYEWMETAKSMDWEGGR